MARKKKKSLEQEFEERKKSHKSFIIMNALVRTGDKIYNNRLFKDYKNSEVEPYKDEEHSFNVVETKALYVEENLSTRAENGEQELYDKIYEYCWKKVKKVISETDTPEQHGLES